MNMFTGFGPGIRSNPVASRRRRPCSLGYDFMAAVVMSRGGSSPQEVMCACTGLARNPVKPGGDCQMWQHLVTGDQAHGGRD